MIEAGERTGIARFALMLVGAAFAAAPVLADSGAVSAPAALESKARLVKLLLAQSPAVQRIPQSGNSLAQKKLADAQSLYARADSEANAGRTAPAIKMLDQALLEIVAASRLVPDAAQQAEQESVRFISLRESVRTFLGLQQSLSSRLSEKRPAETDVARIDGMMAKAEVLAAGNSHKEANALLNDIYNAVVLSINRMLMAETIVYGVKFDTPADEFQHELGRNRGYEELIPLALRQLNPPRETALLSERYVIRSKELREVAQKHAGKGDYPSALKTIQDATSQLQRSLQIAGVVIPQSQQEGNP